MSAPATRRRFEEATMPDPGRQRADPDGRGERAAGRPAGVDRLLGDATAFADACAAERLSVFRTLLAVSGDPDLAEDLAQDTLRRALERREQYRGDAPLGAWLHRIALNSWRDHVRWRRLRRWVGLDDPAADAVAAPAGGDADATLDLRRALARLPDRQRAAIVLRYYHDYDYAEIGAALGVTAGSAGSILSRAVDRLEVELRDRG
jgi:RNA polymerase sigma-70 factor (ECF subfamily)